MSKLPKGWEWTTIGEAAEVVLGQSPPGTSYNDVGDGLPFFQGKAEFGELHPKVAKWTTAARKVARENDVLLSVRAPVGPTNLAPTTCSIGRGLAALRETSAVGHRYLLWWMRASADDLASRATGSTFEAVSGAQVRAHPMPLAPRAEQERIVAAIEEHLSRLDAAEAGMRSAATRLSMMRSSLLEEVTRGDWVSRPLGEVLLSLRNGCFVSRPKADPPGLPILRISAVRPLSLDPADVRYAPESLDRAAEYEVRAGDLLFTRYSGNPDYVGACAVVPPEGAGMLHPDKLIRGVPDPSLALSGWIAMAVSASVGRRQIEQRLKTTAGQVGISGSQLKSVLIPLPPLDEQAARHRRWEDGLEAMTRLRSELESCSARAERARRAILAAAFSGQLVPQDPDDEPASVLLERIRAERAAAAPTKRTRKVKAS